MVAKSSSLTTGEKRQLKDYEAVIEKGLASFVDVGNALIAIRDGKLYTDSGDTFEAYCKSRWNFAKSHAYRLIDSANVVRNLSPMGDIPAPVSERVARELAAIPDERKQADVWVKANETAPKDKAGKPIVTASHVKKTAETLAPKAEPAKLTPPAEAKAPEPEADQDEGGHEPSEATPLLKKAEATVGQLMRLADDVAKIVPAKGQLITWRAGVQQVLDSINAIRKLAKK